MKRMIIIFCAVLSIITGTAQTLKFRKDGTFKIAQITDVHFKYGNPASNTSLKLFDEIIATESPDLVLFTGDIVVEPAPVFRGWQEVLSPFYKAGIPVAITLGNHDDEHDKKRNEIVDFLCQQPLCLIRPGDYSLHIIGKDNRTQAHLYLFDSNAYSTLPTVKGYGWVTHRQVEEYLNSANEILPSLAFFHIPLPEFREAYMNNEKHPPVGQQGENECSPEINTGLFAAMLERGDIMGCFVGHDHNNNYIAYKNGIALAYCNSSSEGTTYGDLPAASRIIVLKEGQRAFETYIYQLGGKKILHHNTQLEIQIKNL